MSQRAYPYRVPEIEAMLLNRIDALADTLLPGGRIHGSERINGYALGHDLSSFSLNRASGSWIHGAAARGSKGALPLLSLVAYLVTDDRWKTENGRPGAIAWALDWLGLSGTAPDPARSEALAKAAAVTAHKREVAEAEATEKRRQAAHAIWLDAQPVTAGDPVWLYLAGRGIDLSRFSDVPAALRYAPKCRYYRGPKDWIACPAMVAAMHREGVPKGFAAVHRTYLAPIHGEKNKIVGWGKAFGKHSKTILGPKSGATIRLTRGESGHPLGHAPAGEWVALAEGVENALSAALVHPEWRVLAAGTLENVGKIVLPATVGGVRILADNDPPGSTAWAGLDAACTALLERGIDLEIFRAPVGFKDFNDALMGRRVAA